jgi:hypothetical protein
MEAGKMDEKKIFASTIAKANAEVNSWPASKRIAYLFSVSSGTIQPDNWGEYDVRDREKTRKGGTLVTRRNRN